MLGKILGIVIALAAYYGLSGPSFNPASVKGKNVLITGASSGIGEELAYKYCSLDANVFIAARRESELKRVQAKCQSLSSAKIKVGFARADMGDMKSTRSLVDAAVKELGGLDVLVLNHAMLTMAPEYSGSKENLDNFDRMHEVNVRSYVHLMGHSYQHLKANGGGSVLVIGSVNGRQATEGMAEYSANKFAISAYFDALRYEMGPRGDNVTVTHAILGFIKTPPAVKMFDEFNAEPPYGWILPEEVANTLVPATAAGVRDVYLMRPFYYGHLILRLYNFFPDWVHGWAF